MQDALFLFFVCLFGEYLSFVLNVGESANQSESHSGLQQLRFTRNYMGAWRT